MSTLTAARKVLGLSVSEFAEKAGLDRTFIWRVEERGQRCAPESAIRIHRASRGLVSLESLLLGQASRKRRKDGSAGVRR